MVFIFYKILSRYFNFNDFIFIYFSNSIVPELPARHRSPPPPDFDKLLTERDNLIRHLQMEVERLS
jgi:hypothetical protein